jgi:hypothetical protein
VFVRLRAAALALAAAGTACGESGSEAPARPDAGSGGSSGAAPSGGAGGMPPGGSGGQAGSSRAGEAGSYGGAAGSADAGSDAAIGLPDCEGPVASLLLAGRAAIVAAGSDAYVPPEANLTRALGRSITSADGGDVPSALAEAQAAGYSLCLDTGGVALWRPLEPSRGAAAVALRRRAGRPLIVEAPHPIYDSRTLEQAIVLFDRLPARAIVTSGTHRCANSRSSTCSGSTEACSKGSPQSYRESDMAHVDLSFFHAAHVTLAHLYASDWVVGVHGMADAGVSLSDGTSRDTTADSPVARIAAALVESFGGAGLASGPVTTCNTYPGAPAVQLRLCGTTDVQGRHLNGSLNACTSSATSSSSRFIHLEQSLRVRDNPDLVVSAFDAVVPR